MNSHLAMQDVSIIAGHFCIAILLQKSQYFYAGTFCKSIETCHVLQGIAIKASERHSLVFCKLLQYRYIMHEILYHTDYT